MRPSTILIGITATVITVFHPASVRADAGARYAVSVALDWSAEAHPIEYPRGAHWSRLLAVSHTDRYVLFSDGRTASGGLSLLATNGRTSILEAELAEARRRGRAGEPVVAPGPATGTGRVDLDIAVTSELPLVSFATMLAPSPDWFAGAASIDLRDGTHWLRSVEIPIWLWDAGADSGATFEAPDAETQPQQSIRLVTHPAFLAKSGLKPIGTATFVRLEP